MMQFDDEVYNTFTKIDKEVSYGQYYVQKLEDRAGNQDY